MGLMTVWMTLTLVTIHLNGVASRVVVKSRVSGEFLLWLSRNKSD